MEDFFVPSCLQELTHFTWLPKQFETFPWMLSVSTEIQTHESSEHPPFWKGWMNTFRIRGKKQPQGVKMKQELKHSCSEVGMVLGSSQPWCYTDAGFISFLSTKWERAKCPLHTHYQILPEEFPPTFILISYQNHWERTSGNVDLFVLLFTFDSKQYNAWLGSDLTWHATSNPKSTVKLNHIGWQSKSFKKLKNTKILNMLQINLQTPNKQSLSQVSSPWSQ